MFSFPVPALFTVTILTSWLAGVIRGVYSKSKEAATRSLWEFNLLQNLFCLIVIGCIFLFSGGFGHFSIFSVMLGILIGSASVFGADASLKALAAGPFSYTTVICTVLSIIIPTFSGLFFGEQIRPLQYVGIALMVVCVILSPEQEMGSDRNRFNAKWLILCIAAGVFSGIVGVIQKTHQNSASYGSEMAALLLSGFLTASILSAVFLRADPKHSGISIKALFSSCARTVWLYPAAAGICFAFPNTINLYLAGKVDAVIMFPLVNLCPLLLSMAAAVTIFREHLSPKRWAGIGIGVLSMLLISGVLG